MYKLYRLIAVVLVTSLFIVWPTSSWAAPIDLSSFVTEDYVTVNGPSNWIVGGLGNSDVTQSNNSDPSIFRSGGTIDVSNKRISGEFSITGTDDDLAGFVFGYQNRGQMYLFGWKEQAQSGTLMGMFLARIDTGDPAMDPGILDFANTGADTAAKTILRENAIPWERNTTYDFVLDFAPGNFDITISNGATALETWIISDSTFTNGDFGFFNNSQAGVTYGNLEVIPIPAAAWLFGSGLLGLVGIARHKQAA